MHIATTACVWQQEKAAAMGAGAGDVAASWRVAAVALLGAVNCVVSFVVFSFLDLLDMVLCVVYKVVDYAVEAEWKACYCSAAARDGAAAAIFVPPASASAAPGPKVVRLSPSSAKMQLEDVSDTLYVRPSLLSDATKKSGPAAPSLTVSPAIAELIRGKIGRAAPRPPRHAAPCWSDCDCKVCHSWSASSRSSHLYVHVQSPTTASGVETEDVVFVHGFISSSVFWTETVFPAFSEAAKGRYRMFAVDLLGFGRSPKPADSLYTLREHVEMIERSVLQRYRLRKFHVVAHSLGSVLALALAVKYPDAVQSLTLLAPPYFPVPEEEAGAATQYVMRRVAPIAFGASMACWMRTFLIEAFMCHTHNAAWHTLHNIICGSAGKMDSYLDVVAGQLACEVAVFHGRDDELLPVECTLAVGARVPRARVTVYDHKDHITIIVGQEKLFATELEDIWRRSAAAAAAGDGE
uniref:AB hydrolase-1 domain-containing protein n=1 Tax=Oryza barthii TaxID=65489 RepID=A0A0D3GCE3_9ORYZ